MREWPSERQISRESLMKTIENLTVSNEQLLNENNTLRDTVAIKNKTIAVLREHLRLAKEAIDGPQSKSAV